MERIIIRHELPLHAAAANDDVAALAHVLAEPGADVNARDAAGDAGIHLATRMCALRSLSALVAAGADVNAKTGNGGYTPLHIAVKQRSAGAVKLLLDAGADMWVYNDAGMAPFHCAVAACDVEMCAALRARFEGPPSANLERELANATGGTAMHLAARAGSVPMMRWLLEAKANLHAKNKLGKTPTDVAQSSGHSQVLEWVKDTVRSRAAAEREAAAAANDMLAAASNHVDALRVMVETGASVTCRDRRGNTLLHRAAEAGYLPAVEYLLMALPSCSTLNPNVVNSDGWTPLHLAARAGAREVVERLLDFGADVAMTNTVDDAAAAKLKLRGVRSHAEAAAGRPASGILGKVKVSALDLALAGDHEDVAAVLRSAASGRRTARKGTGDPLTADLRTLRGRRDPTAASAPGSRSGSNSARGSQSRQSATPRDSMEDSLAEMYGGASRSSISARFSRAALEEFAGRPSPRPRGKTDAGVPRTMTMEIGTAAEPPRPPRLARLGSAGDEEIDADAILKYGSRAPIAVTGSRQKAQPVGASPTSPVTTTPPTAARGAVPGTQSPLPRLHARAPSYAAVSGGVVGAPSVSTPTPRSVVPPAFLPSAHATALAAALEQAISAAAPTPEPAADNISPAHVEAASDQPAAPPRAWAVVEMESWLLERRLQDYLPALEGLGCTALLHLCYLTDEDLRGIDMKPVHRRILLQGVDSLRTRFQQIGASPDAGDSRPIAPSSAGASETSPASAHGASRNFDIPTSCNDPTASDPMSNYPELPAPQGADAHDAIPAMPVGLALQRGDSAVTLGSAARLYDSFAPFPTHMGAPSSGPTATAPHGTAGPVTAEHLAAWPRMQSLSRDPASTFSGQTFDTSSSGDVVRDIEGVYPDMHAAMSSSTDVSWPAGALPDSVHGTRSGDSFAHSSAASTDASGCSAAPRAPGMHLSHAVSDSAAIAWSAAQAKTPAPAHARLHSAPAEWMRGLPASGAPPSTTASSQTPAEPLRSDAGMAHPSTSAPLFSRFLAPDSSLNRLVIPSTQVRVLRQVGRGGFGDVFQAQWRGSDVAVKRLRRELVDHLVQNSEDHDDAAAARPRKAEDRRRRLDELAARALRDLETEALVSERVNNHNNIVAFRGVILDAYLGLVTEFMCYGSAQELLVKRGERYRRDEFHTHQIARMAMQAAAGLLHLHASSVLHRDIAARNLLVGEGFVTKVADFGFSRVRRSNEQLAAHFSTSSHGPVFWMAPESLQHHRYSTASDVFAFGVALWELFTGHMPWEEYVQSGSTWRVPALIIEGQRLPLPAAEVLPHPALRPLIEQCWLAEAARRPTMNDVLDVLVQVHEELAAAPWRPADVLPLHGGETSALRDIDSGWVDSSQQDACASAGHLYMPTPDAAPTGAEAAPTAEFAWTAPALEPIGVAALPLPAPPSVAPAASDIPPAFATRPAPTASAQALKSDMHGAVSPMPGRVARLPASSPHTPLAYPAIFSTGHDDLHKLTSADATVGYPRIPNLPNAKASTLLPSDAGVALHTQDDGAVDDAFSPADMAVHAFSQSLSGLASLGPALADGFNNVIASSPPAIAAAFTRAPSWLCIGAKHIDEDDAEHLPTAVPTAPCSTLTPRSNPVPPVTFGTPATTMSTASASPVPRTPGSAALSPGDPVVRRVPLSARIKRSHLSVDADARTSATFSGDRLCAENARRDGADPSFAGSSGTGAPRPGGDEEAWLVAELDSFAVSSSPSHAT